MIIVMFIIFVLTNISIIGIFSFVYKGKECYKDGMILGIHLPQEKEQDADVLILTKNFKKRLTSYHLVNLIISFGICFLWFVNSTAFMISWTLWLLAYTLIGTFLIVLAQRSMYRLKVQKEWKNESLGEQANDDDIYWKNGWYSNSNDSRFWVRDRINPLNYSMNMAKRSAKIATGIMSVATVLLLTVFFTILIRLDHTEVNMIVSDKQVTIEAAMYDTVFQKEEIQSLEILENLPDEDFDRTNGGATEKYLIGHFEGEQSGTCMLYIYRGYAPILKIKLKDRTVFVNSREEHQVQEWYQMLAE